MWDAPSMGMGTGRVGVPGLSTPFPQSSRSPAHTVTRGLREEPN